MVCGVKNINIIVSGKTKSFKKRFGHSMMEGRNNHVSFVFIEHKLMRSNQLETLVERWKYDL